MKMPAFLVTLLSWLGLAETDLPQIESAISGFFTYLISEIKAVWPQVSAGVSEAQTIFTSVETQLELLVKDLDGVFSAKLGTPHAMAAPTSVEWLRGMLNEKVNLGTATDQLDALEQMFPNTSKAKYAVYVAMNDTPGITLSVATKMVENAHATIRQNAKPASAKVPPVKP